MGDAACPTCGAGAERGQLVCLECGSRIALTYRRPPSWKVPVAISAVLLILAVVGSVLAYKAIADEAQREAAANPAKAGPNTGEARTGGTAQTEDVGAAEPGAGRALTKKGALYSWPGSLSAFTVVLQSSEDSASASSFARSAAKGNSDKIGVIRSNEFDTLPKDFFIVFAGRYPNRAKADAAATRLEQRFPGAFPQRVKK